MYIKNIFNVINYKGLEDGISVEFENITYILGDNAKLKSTIGSIPLWILTGYNLQGSNRECVANDENKNYINTTASMTIIDNDGVEHIITRSKGKDNFVLLDEIKTTQEMLVKFYKDVHSFICVYNPSYFRSLKLSEQREILLRILPAISSKDAFNLLVKQERDILGSPIVDIGGYCKAKRKEIKQLNSELDKISGMKSIYIETAIQKEDELVVFSKQKELQQLEDEYERLITNSNEIISIEDLEMDIAKLNKKIDKNIKEELKELQERYKKETENLNSVNSSTSTCPRCKQQIKNENLIKALTITYRKNINKIEEKIKNLKLETQELINKKNIQLQKHKIAKNPKMQQLQNKKNEIKEKIDYITKEKSEIDLKNKEITLKHNQIIYAKSKLEALGKKEEEIKQKIEKDNKQLDIAIKLNSLMIDEQMKKARQYLNKVTIELSKVDEEKKEIVDIYSVKLINKVTKINSPIFIDDAESITDIQTSIESQIIISIVLKYNELEILYSYPEVLNRKKESINKEIEQSNELLTNAA